MSYQQEESLLLEEAIKILGTNKKKASALRSLMLNKNYRDDNDLQLQIIQYLGELEYDFQTVFELFTEFLKSSKKQNFSQKNDIDTNLERSLVILNEQLKLVQTELTKTKNENENLKKFVKYQQQFVNNTETDDNNYNNESKRNIITRHKKKQSNSLIDNKSVSDLISNYNINSNLNFDYDSYFLKLDNNKINFDSINKKSSTMRSKRLKSCNKNNKRYINDTFQDDKLNANKTKYSTNVEDNLLDRNTNSNFYNLIEDVMKKFKESPGNTPLIKKRKKEIDIKKGNLNLKTPKRYSHIK